MFKKIALPLASLVCTGLFLGYLVMNVVKPALRIVGNLLTGG